MDQLRTKPLEGVFVDDGIEDTWEAARQHLIDTYGIDADPLWDSPAGWVMELFGPADKMIAALRSGWGMDDEQIAEWTAPPPPKPRLAALLASTPPWSD